MGPGQAGRMSGSNESSELLWVSGRDPARDHLAETIMVEAMAWSEALQISKAVALMPVIYIFRAESTYSRDHE